MWIQNTVFAFLGRFNLPTSPLLNALLNSCQPEMPSLFDQRWVPGGGYKRCPSLTLASGWVGYSLKLCCAFHFAEGSPETCTESSRNAFAWNDIILVWFNANVSQTKMTNLFWCCRLIFWCFVTHQSLVGRETRHLLPPLWLPTLICCNSKWLEGPVTRCYS